MVIVLQTQELIGISYIRDTTMHMDSVDGLIFCSMLVQELLSTEDIGTVMDSPVDTYILHSLVFSFCYDHGDSPMTGIDNFFLLRYHIIKDI
jgi:hypothetical protein